MNFKKAKTILLVAVKDFLFTVALMRLFNVSSIIGIWLLALVGAGFCAIEDFVRLDL